MEATTEAPVEKKTAAEVPKKKGSRKAFLIFFAVLLVLAAVGLLFWLHARHFESTDDAQVDAHLTSISARIDGTVSAVHVDNNDVVQAGQALVELDPRDYQVALDQAQASLAQAQSQISGQEPNIPITQVENVTNISTGQADVANSQAALAAAERDQQASAAKVAESEANNARAQADLGRYRVLMAKEEVSAQEFDQISTTAQAQTATVAANRAGLASAAELVAQRQAQLRQAQSRLQQAERNGPRQIAIRTAAVVSERASAKSAAAQVEAAELKLSYGRITAPAAGIVMSRSAEVGAHVTAGQQLFQIAQTGDLWLTANFKETQLRDIRAGQHATIHVDALKQDFEGRVQSIGGATGAVASVLPPENATGNYVKVVQRIPVRIRFAAGQPGLDRLRVGMSAEPEVRIGD